MSALLHRAHLASHAALRHSSRPAAIRFASQGHGAVPSGLVHPRCLPRSSLACHAQQQHEAPRFDLPLAVGLAGAAFEAYLEPLGGAGFEDMALNGSRTVFMDRQFLTELYQGILFVELISGANLRAADFTGASDPYAVLSVGGSIGRSNACFQTLNPTWNTKMCLYVRDAGSDVLRVRVFDKDILTSDDDLGMVILPIASLQGKGQQELELPLQGPGAGEGRVKLRVTYLAFSEFPEDVKQQMTATKAVIPGQEGTLNTQDMTKKVPEIMDKVVRDRERRRRRSQQSGLHALIDQGMDSVKGQVMQAANGLLQQATAGFGPQEELSPWKVLATMVGEAASAFKPVAFVDNPGTDTQVWLFANREKREAVIAFRGTEQIKWKDLVTDINLTPTDLNPERLDSDAGKPLAMRLVAAALGAQDMRVHSGFLNAYDSVRQQVVRLLDSLTGVGKEGAEQQPWRVMVTGHSLGGALATLCAFELSNRQGAARRAQRVTMYSYGAPRAGNKVFAEHYDRLVPDSWRITNSNDIVPSVPRLLGYAHVKHSVSVASDGTLLVQTDSKDVFGEGRGGVDVIQELVDKVNAQGKSWEQVYDEIAAHEMEILNALVDGSALEEHMETFYLETLKACVMATVSKTDPSS